MPEREDAFSEEEAVYAVIDDDGVEREMIPVWTFDHNQRDYVVLIDRNDPEADGLILRMEQEGEEIVLYNIEDDAEWEEVEAIYNEIVTRNGG